MNVLIGAVIILMLCASAADAQFIIGTPKNLGPLINTPGLDAGPNVSSDGLVLYFMSDRPGGAGGWDLWLATRKSAAETWEPPINLGEPVNTRFNEASASLSSDGLELYFDSNRPGGQGSVDIWVSRRASRSTPWGTPESLGPVINSVASEGTPKLSADGLSLFFNSDRAGGLGATDIWVSTRTSLSARWRPPVNLGPVVNGPNVDWCPAISPDGLALAFQSNRPGGLGGDDFWVTTRATLISTWTQPVHLSADINTQFEEGKVDFSRDGATMYFMSNRPGGAGSFDIWEAPIEIRLPRSR
jgi:Tol biopolymer transport system component